MRPLYPLLQGPGLAIHIIEQNQQSKIPADNTDNTPTRE